MSKRIYVDVMDDGEVRIETKGFKGPVCLAETQFLKELLGEEVSRQLCASYYQKNNESIKKHIPLCG